METLKLEKILNQREQMPRRQRALCEYLLQNTNEADGLTAKQLAQKSGVGEATIFRFLKEQGYPSYGEFRRELHQYAVDFLQSSYWQMKASLQERGAPAQPSPLYREDEESVERLGKTVTPKLSEQFDLALDLLSGAPEVGVLGLRSSKAVALYGYYLLLPLLPQVRQLSHDEHFVFEMIRNLPAGSAVLVVASWPNTRTTVRAAEFCRRMGHRVILLTNRRSCPVAAYADALLVVPESRDRYTVVPYVAVLEALVREIGARRAPASLQRLEELDEILAEQEVTDWNGRG